MHSVDARIVFLKNTYLIHVRRLSCGLKVNIQSKFSAIARLKTYKKSTLKDKMFAFVSQRKDKEKFFKADSQRRKTKRKFGSNIQNWWIKVELDFFAFFP
jgi:basic membrane lipoprotein Med (substrate-binding protein (PBP1-ABC) superfamily)